MGEETISWRLSAVVGANGYLVMPEDCTRMESEGRNCEGGGGKDGLAGLCS